MLPMSAEEQLGERIRARRLRRAMSQTDLALDVGTHQARVSDWERGKYYPSVHSLVSIAKALKCLVSDLLMEGEDDGETDGPVFRSRRS